MLHALDAGLQLTVTFRCCALHLLLSAFCVLPTLDVNLDPTNLVTPVPIVEWFAAQCAALVLLATC
eukprot:m.31341 g.31341  ORF g.31341 m.31341 type:complete len:66 (-) comp9410_c0_seq1:46-243(-)